MVIQNSFAFSFTISGNTNDVPIYGLLFIFGFAIAIVTAIPKVKKLKFPFVDVVVSAVFAVVGGALGAKLFSILTSIPQIIEYQRVVHPTALELIKILLSEGFVFYGGLIGGALGLVIYAKAFKVPLLKLFDLYAAGTALGHSFGRVGCLLSGCCYGLPTSGPFWVMYPSTGNISDLLVPRDVHLFPIQLVESMILLVIFAVCETVFYRTKRTGLSAIVYSLSYATARFILEFFRGDTVRGVYGGMSTSQFISVGIILLVLISIDVALYRSYRAKKRRLAQPS